MTFKSAIFDKRVRISSWIPSAKYALALSSLKFSNGITAMLFSGIADAMAELFGFCCRQKRKLPITNTAMRIKTAAPINGHFEIADFGLFFTAAGTAGPTSAGLNFSGIA